MPTNIVYRQQGETKQAKMFGFAITDDQANFMKEHKEVNWRATVRAYLVSIISEVQQKETENKSFAATTGETKPRGRPKKSD